ncbi:MAG: CoA transferase, partial [Dehalococcoidia bacterium]|nr:CoA transferase [Dehalococcoidia bacterium]
MPAALDGVRIIDLSVGVAGAYCTKLLAGFVAEVINVAPPGPGDPIRAFPPA